MLNQASPSTLRTLEARCAYEAENSHQSECETKCVTKHQAKHAGKRKYRTTDLFKTLFLGQHRSRALAGAFLAAIASLCSIALLAISGWFITATAFAGLTLATALAFNVFVPSASIRLLALGRTASRYGERLLTHDATLAALADLRARLFKGWSTPDLARSLASHPAKLLFRLSTDVDALDGMYLKIAVPLFVATVSTLLLGVLFASLEPAFGLLAVSWILITTAAISLRQIYVARRSAIRRTVLLERHRAQAIDFVSGQTELIMTQRLESQQLALLRTASRIEQEEVRLARIDATSAVWQSITATVLTAATLLFVAVWVKLGHIELASGVLAVLASLAVNESLTVLRRSLTDTTRTAIAIKRLAGVIMSGNSDLKLSTPQETQTRTVWTRESADRSRLKQSATTIHCHDLSLSYHNSDHPVINGLSLHINPGEKVAVVGASASGKSTLLAALAGELSPTAGTLVCKHSTLVSQQPRLFKDTLAANLRIAAPDASDECLWWALRMAGLDHDLRNEPDSLDTMLGEAGLGLSAGQKRRLTLARLLLLQRPIWLLDEPTEGLDSTVANDILDRLFEHATDQTVVLATHLRREAKHADRIIVLNHGRIKDDVRRTNQQFQDILSTLRPD